MTWPRKVKDGKWACGGAGDTKHRIVYYDDHATTGSACFLCSAVQELHIAKAQLVDFEIQNGKPASPNHRIVALINELRAEEGDYVTILCDNPDFNGQPDRNVDVRGEWTNWVERRFGGDTLLEALEKAAEAKREAIKE